MYANLLSAVWHLNEGTNPHPVHRHCVFYAIKYNTDLGDYGIMPTNDIIQQVCKCMKQEEVGFSRRK